MRNFSKPVFSKISQKGFTLMELIASMAVIAIITAVVFSNQNQLQNDLELTNIAYKIALEIRQAQVYGISVKQTQTGDNNFDASYGVHFNDPAEVPKSLIFFVDYDGDGFYSSDNDSDCDNADECLEKVTLGRGNVIKKLCGLFQNDRTDCAESPNPGDLEALDIVFKRPDPDARMKAYSTYEMEPTPDHQEIAVCDELDCGGWAICLQSPAGRNKRVVVLSTGQISVENVAAGETCSD